MGATDGLLARLARLKADRKEEQTRPALRRRGRAGLAGVLEVASLVRFRFARTAGTCRAGDGRAARRGKQRKRGRGGHALSVARAGRGRVAALRSG